MPDLTLDIWLAAHDEFSGAFEKLGVAAEGLSGKIGLVSGAFGVLAGGALAESVKQASDYSTMINHVAANTTMTTQGIKEMSAAVQDMAAHSSAHMEDLAQAWMHVTDLGFTKAADAQKVVQAAMESALSTGGSVVDTANVLANAMHEFSIKAQDAGHAMDVLHLASAEGNTTLEDFVEGAGRAIGMAANLGVSLQDASAAISALTRHGFDASTASTQLVGMLEHITNPSKAARDEIARLSKQTGIDLVYDFSQAGLHAKGLSGVLADVQKATRGNASEIEKLIPALRGGLGAMTLTGTGAADFRQILGDLNDTMAGKTNPTAEAYARTQQTLSFQLGVLRNNLQEMAIAIGSAVLPALTKLTGAVVPVIQHIADWMKHHGALVAGLLAGASVVGTLTGALLILGPVIGALVSPIGLVVVAIGGAIAGLVAFATHSKGFRDLLSGIWSGIADDAGQLWSWLTGIWNGISGDAMLLWENLGGWLSDTWNAIVSAAAPIWNGLVNTIKYVWGRITGDKDLAGAALAAIPAQWHPLVQAIGDVLSGSWFTVKYIWDSLFGSKEQARKDLAGIPTAWHPLVQGIGDTLSGAWFTVKYLWDTLFGSHKDATADLRKIKPEWQPLVQGIGDTLSGSFFTVKYLWDDLWGDHNKATGDLKKIPTEWQPLVKKIGHVFTEAKHDIISFWNEVGKTAKKAWNESMKPTLHDMHHDWDKFLKDLAPLVGPATDNVKKVLAAAATPLGVSMNLIIGALRGAWHGFWHGDQKGGAKQLLLDGLHFLGTTIKGGAHIIEDAILILFSLAGLKWDKAKKYIEDAVHTLMGWWAQALQTKDKVIEDAWDAVVGAFKGYFEGFYKAAKEAGGKIVQNIADGIKSAPGEVLKHIQDLMGAIARFLPHSPAEEGPLSRMPSFTHIADAMRAAIPHVQAASRDLASAATLGGGPPALGLGASSSTISGLAAPGGPGAALATGSTGARSLAITNNITIQGGTFTDQRSIQDLAHKVSEEIMHSVRMQGGLLPQI